MTSPVFGLQFIRTDDEARPVLDADLSTIGIIGPAGSANVDIFPLDTPVKVYSSDTTLTASLGTAGYLLDAVRGIQDQLADMQYAAQVVIVRTAAGTDSDPAIALEETIAKIMGDPSAGTGMWAFLSSPDALGCTPRLIIAPGYTSQSGTTLETITATTPGTGYVAGQRYELTFSGGSSFSGGGTDPTVVQASGHAVADSTGHIGTAQLVIDTYGCFFTGAPAVTIEAPVSGTRAILSSTIGEGANPVCASLPAILNKLLGHAVVESAGTSESDDLTWRSQINSSRLIPVRGGCKILDPDTATIVVRPFAPRVAGIAVRRDFETDGPFHSWANQPVAGIVGPALTVPFNLLDGANVGQSLLGANVGILVRGEVGNDTAISSGGYIFIGTDNAGDDVLWQFYNVTRGRDAIHIALIRVLRSFLGRSNITSHTVQSIINTMDYYLRDLQARDNILGFKMGFNGSLNSAEEIRLGHLTVSFMAEEPPVLRRLTTMSGRYRDAIDAMVSALERQLNLAA